MDDLQQEQLKNLISIGFCQRKFYKTTVWNYATKIMERAVKLNLVIPFDFGRGKGKYKSALTVDKLLYLLKDDLATEVIVNKYMKYLSK